MSACFSYSRLKRRNAVPRPNCVPCEITWPQPPPMIAPRTAPAIWPIWYFVRLARLRGAVAQRDVAQLVRHHAGDFAFGVRRFDHAAVDEHRSAGQRERVDLSHVDRLERVAELGMPEIRWNRRHQPPADVLDDTTSRCRRA